MAAKKTKDQFTQEEITALQKEFGAEAVADFFEIADYIAANRGGVDGIAEQIEAGTKDRIELKRTARLMYKDGRGYTMEAIAQKLGVSLGTVHNWIRGK